MERPRSCAPPSSTWQVDVAEDRYGAGVSGANGFEEERLVDAAATDTERAAESALRPKMLAEFVGQGGHVVW